MVVHDLDGYSQYESAVQYHGEVALFIEFSRADIAMLR